MKTGTTIAGIVYKDGVVLGADTRATGGSEVADKNCEKIHYLAPNIYCCGAGTAADTEKTTEMIRWVAFLSFGREVDRPVAAAHTCSAYINNQTHSSQLDLLRLSTGAPSRVVTACTMLKRMLFRYQGHVSAALVLGGVDNSGSHLYQVTRVGNDQYPSTRSCLNDARSTNQHARVLHDGPSFESTDATITPRRSTRTGPRTRTPT